jgi:hypothetical protein
MAKAPIDIRSLARKHTSKAVNVLAGIMKSESHPAAARVSAAQALLDRGWGKAAQPLTGGDDEDNPLKVIARIERVIVEPEGQ